MIYVLRSSKFINGEVDNKIRNELFEKVRLYYCKKMTLYEFKIMHLLNLTYQRIIEQNRPTMSDNNLIDEVRHLVLSAFGRKQNERTFAETCPGFDGIKSHMMSFIKLFFPKSIIIEDFDIQCLYENSKTKTKIFPKVVIDKTQFKKDIDKLLNDFNDLANEIHEDVMDMIHYFLSQYIDNCIVKDYTLLKHNDVFSTIEEMQKYYEREKIRNKEVITEDDRNQKKEELKIEIVAYSTKDIDFAMPFQFSVYDTDKLFKRLINSEELTFWALLLIAAMEEDLNVHPNKFSNRNKKFWNMSELSDVLKNIVYVSVKSKDLDDLIIVDSNPNKFMFKMNDGSIIFKNNNTPTVLESDMIRIKYHGDVNQFNSEVMYYFPHMFLNGNKIYQMCSLVGPIQKSSIIGE